MGTWTQILSNVNQFLMLKPPELTDTRVATLLDGIQFHPFLSILISKYVRFNSILSLAASLLFDLLNGVPSLVITLLWYRSLLVYIILKQPCSSLGPIPTPRCARTCVKV